MRSLLTGLLLFLAGRDAMSDARDGQRLWGHMRGEAAATVAEYHQALAIGDTAVLRRLSLFPDSVSFAAEADTIGAGVRVVDADFWPADGLEGRVRFEYLLRGVETTGGAHLEWKAGRWRVKHYFLLAGH